MPALIPTNYRAQITWIGRVAYDAELCSVSCEQAMAHFGGFEDEKHRGLTRPSCSRVLDQHPRNTEIANVRQLSVLSAEEMLKIAQNMGLQAIDPSLVGASLILEGIPDFSHLPPSSRLQCEESGACLVVDMANRPCVLPGRQIEAKHQGFGAKFKEAANGLRGITAWVEREGLLRVGDTMRLHVPDQRAWAP